MKIIWEYLIKFVTYFGKCMISCCCSPKTGRSLIKLSSCTNQPKHLLPVFLIYLLLSWNSNIRKWKLGEHLKRQCQLHVWWVSRLGFQRRKKIKFKVQSLPSNLRDKQCVKLSLRWASAVKNNYYPGMELHRHKLDILICHCLNFLNKELSLLINAVNNDFQINVTYF